MTLDEISRFTKLIYKNDDLTCKHVVNISNYVNDETSQNKLVKVKNKSNLTVYDITDKKTFVITKGLSLFTDDHINISANIIMKDIFNNKTNPYCQIFSENFPQFLSMLNSGEKWMCDKEYEKLFKFDASGNTVGLSDTKIASSANLRRGWVYIKPSVIFVDENPGGIQGIFMKSNTGILGNFKGEEFLCFVNYMREIMNNFYNSSLNLYNAGLLSLLLGGFINGNSSKE